MSYISRYIEKKLLTDWAKKYVSYDFNLHITMLW